MERQDEVVGAGMHLGGTERPDADILIAVIGQIDDQFAMDEHDGYLRVATSTVKYSEDAASPGSFRTEVGSRLSVLAPQPAAGGGNMLALIGEYVSRTFIQTKARPLYLMARGA